MKKLLTLGLLAFLVGCSGPPNSEHEDPALDDVWAGMEAAASTMTEYQNTPCADTFGTWFEEFGVRGLACIAADVVDPVEIVARAGMDVFTQGPHTVENGSFSLNLTSIRDFGHYNPVFVDWLMDNGVVGVGRPAVRALTQPIYDSYMKRLARAYYVTFEDMAADGYPAAAPPGPLSDYAYFLDGRPIPDNAVSYDGGFSVYSFTELSEGLLPRLELQIMNQWEAIYELNTAYGFWLRRRVDGTHEHWHDGLVQLLETYDGEWIARR